VGESAVGETVGAFEAPHAASSNPSVSVKTVKRKVCFIRVVEKEKGDADITLALNTRFIRECFINRQKSSKLGE